MAISGSAFFIQTSQSSSKGFHRLNSPPSAITLVLPGGMARIRGEKLMRLSQGEEWIQLSGLIRLADVDADNRISSTRIADADIAYGGRGHIQRSSQPGWLSQFFTMVSPF